MDMFPDIGLPDWGLGDGTEDSITRVRFGDGYELRAPDGLNFRRPKWSPKWSHLDDETGDMAYQWLLERKQLTAFLWQHPTRNTIYKVICDDVSLVADQYGNRVLSATFYQDFNP